MLLVGTGTGPKITDSIHKEVCKEGTLYARFTVHDALAACFGFLSLFPFMQQM